MERVETKEQRVAAAREALRRAAAAMVASGHHSDASARVAAAVEGVPDGAEGLGRGAPTGQVAEAGQ